MGTGANNRPDRVEVPNSPYFFGSAGSGIGRYRDLPPRGPEKATVLLLHGWAGTAELNWSHVYAPLVAAGYRVLAPDLPGHGHGARDMPFTFDGVADAAAGLVRDSSAGRALVAGHSMGGSLALTLAARHPDLVQGLVLMATQADWPGLPARPLLKLAGRLGTVATRPLMRWGARSILSGDTGKDRWIHDELRPTQVARLVQALIAMREFDAEPWLAQLRVPVVVLVTTRDTLVAPARQRRLAAAIAGARVVEVAIDHSDPPSRPGEFPEKLVAALELCLEASVASS